MTAFIKKDTLTKTISFMAIMASINVIFSLLAAFVPFLSVLLIIFLPITSALVEVYCKDKYFVIYAFGTLGLCFVATIWNIDFAIFYIVPSIIAGYFFGLTTKKNIPTVWSILLTSISQTILSFLFVPLMELITERNIIDDVIQIFCFDNIANFKDWIIVIFYLVSLIQTILSYVAVNAELKRLGVEHYDKNNINKTFVITSLLTIGVSIVLFFINKNISHLFIVISFVFSYFYFLSFIKNKNLVGLIGTGITIFLNIFVFAIFNPLIESASVLLILFTPFCIAMLNFLKLSNRKKKEQVVE